MSAIVMLNETMHTFDEIKDTYSAEFCNWCIEVPGRSLLLHLAGKAKTKNRPLERVAHIRLRNPQTAETLLLRVRRIAIGTAYTYYTRSHTHYISQTKKVSGADRKNLLPSTQPTLMRQI